MDDAELRFYLHLFLDRRVITNKQMRYEPTACFCQVFTLLPHRFNVLW